MNCNMKQIAYSITNEDCVCEMLAKQILSELKVSKRLFYPCMGLESSIKLALRVKYFDDENIVDVIECRSNFIEVVLRTPGTIPLPTLIVKILGSDIKKIEWQSSPVK